MLIKDIKKKEAAEKLAEKEKTEKSKKTQLESFLVEHEEDHYNFVISDSFLVSSGSLGLDRALGGGLPPGIHRFSGSSEGGKALSVDELCLTPTGWVEMGTIKVGDFVVGRNGKPTKVIGVYPQGSKEIFEVEFEDGGKTECCDDHLWETTTVNERNLSRRKGFKFSSVKDTKSIRESLIYGDSTYNHCIPYCDPVEFSEIKSKVIDPYVLGVILGDGGITGSSVCITNTDQELIGRVDSILSKEDWYDGLRQNGIAYRIRGCDNDAKNKIKKHLIELNLMGLGSFEKFIPKEYIENASIKERVGLLQGLMDTDGYVKPNSSFCQYYTVSPRLSLDVQELVRSLGGRASISKKSAKYYSHKYEKWISCKDCWKVNISFFNDIKPVSLTRKLANHRPRNYEGGRKIKKITPIGYKEAVCIKVGALDGLFISRDYTVTHNTSQALETIRNFLETVPNSKSLIVKAEGRLSEKMKKRSKIKFVDNAADWVPGTCYIFKCNIYDTVAQLIYDLIQNNENNYKYSFLIDSLDGLILKADTQKSFDGDESVKVCGPNVLTKLLFKRLSLPITELGHLLLVITQVIAKIESKYVAKDQLVVSGGGGNAVIHFASFILNFLPRYKSDLILSSGTSAKMDFEESNVIGHWAKVRLEKTENEKTGLVISYPIKYETEDDCGGIWNELELKTVLEVSGFLNINKAWINFSEAAISLMTAGGISEIPEKFHGVPKFNKYISQTEVSNFWKKTLRDYLSSKDLL